MRRTIGLTLRSISCNSLSIRSQFAKSVSNAAHAGNNDDDNNEFESNNGFMARIFGENSKVNPAAESFYRQFDKHQYQNTSGYGENSSNMDGVDEGFNTLNDGIDNKLKKEATYFEFDIDEIAKPNYAYRPDMNFLPQTTYEVKDLDLRRPGVNKFRRNEIKISTAEALRYADFRNVRFLANFITESGIMHKRSKTGISAKAQRRVAREIKTARAFGLLPFTTMGSKSFVFGSTMADLDEDFQYQTSVERVTDDVTENIHEA